MEETVVALITAHFLGDFVLQTNRMVRDKRRWWVLLGHVCIVTLTSAILLGNGPWTLLVGIFASHLIFDGIKVRLKHDDGVAFLIDQVAHLLTLIALSVQHPDAARSGCWPQLIEPAYLPSFYALQCFLCGLILIVPAGGILIGKLTAPLSEQIKESKIVTHSQPLGGPFPTTDYLTDGLTNGGMYIGWLERLLTLMLILIGEPAGIGFLIAAKSILRFGEIKESRHRKLAEYIIIGTFLSFGWALLTAVATKQAIEHWLPEKTFDLNRVKIVVESTSSTPSAAAQPLNDASRE